MHRTIMTDGKLRIISAVIQDSATCWIALSRHLSLRGSPVCPRELSSSAQLICFMLGAKAGKGTLYLDGKVDGELSQIGKKGGLRCCGW